MRAEVLPILNLQALGVRFLALFGSTARDEASVESDVDLLVALEPAPLRPRRTR